MKFSALILVGVILAGCASQQSEEQAKAELDAKDDAQCQARGLQPGNLKYDDCRAALEDQRTQADRAAMSRRLRGVSPMQN
jgi:hypothetical protein